MPFPTQTSQNAPILDRVVAHITITDRTHSLYGGTFPVIQAPAPAQPTAAFIIQLPTGEYRQVPRAATELANPSSNTVSLAASLLPISVRTLLPLAHTVRRLRGAIEEPPNERVREFTAVPSVDDPNSATPTPTARLPQPLAGSGTEPSAATRSVPGPTPAAPAPTDAHPDPGVTP